MKYVMILGLILLLTGCVTVCPKQSIVEMVWTPIGPMIVQTERDTYSEERHSEERFIEGTGWLTLEEYEGLTEKYKQEQSEVEKEKDAI